MLASQVISPEQFNRFCISYYRDGAYKYQRFGQAFINQFGHEFREFLPDPDIFYEENTGKVQEMIRNKYVKYE